MNPVVEAPGEAVEQRLDVQFVHVVRRVIAGDTGEDRLAHVANAVTVRVLAVKNVGRRADEDAAVPTNHRCRPRQVIDVNRAFVEAAVAVSVLEEANPAKMGCLVPPLRIIAHLDDEQPAVLVERHGDGIHDQRFGSDKIDAETFFDLKRGDGFVRFRGRDAREVFFGDFRFSGEKAQRKRTEKSDGGH